MTTVYQIDVNELTDGFINSIKTKFKNKTINITVTDVIDETGYLLSTKANRDHLAKSIKEAEEGKVSVFTLEEFKNKYSNL